MASTVHFAPATGEDPARVSEAARRLLEAALSGGVELEREVALKVHVGERGNVTFIRPRLFDGVIDLLEERGVRASFIDTNVLYEGDRMTAPSHRALAAEHGFTRLPFVVADGERGEEYDEVELGGKRFRTCKLGRAYSRYRQLIVLAHFKGHVLAGYGGALKQLAMGFASRGGKLAMHVDSKPLVVPVLCKRCGACERACPGRAITVGRWARIDRAKCLGCAACTAVCPHGAVKVNMVAMAGNLVGSAFLERLCEHALAAHRGRRNVYLNFALSITAQCDCVGGRLKVVAPDVGVLASTDPVAVDQACCDLVARAGKRFRHERLLEHAEKIGLGTRGYELVELPQG